MTRGAGLGPMLCPQSPFNCHMWGSQAHCLPSVAVCTFLAVAASPQPQISALSPSPALGEHVTRQPCGGPARRSLPPFAGVPAVASLLSATLQADCCLNLFPLPQAAKPSSLHCLEGLLHTPAPGHHGDLRPSQETDLRESSYLGTKVVRLAPPEILPMQENGL